MPFSQILAISCFLTGVVMAVFIVGLLLAMRFGQQWIQEIVERFTNPDKNRDKNDNQRREQAVNNQQQPQIASSQSLRQRAQSLDFPAPAGNFSAQAAPQGNAYGQENTNPQQPARATLRARDQYPDFNPQTQQQASQQGLQPTMPSLSASRPFQGVAQPQQPQYPQQQGFQQPPQAPQYPQQQGFQQPLPPQQQGFQPLRPQAPQAPQPPQAPQFPQQQGFQQQPQGNFQPLRPQPPQAPQYPPQPPQQGFQQQGFQQAPQPPQQGGLGEYRPGLNNAPRPDLRTQSQRPIRRDTRRQDDQMDEGGLDGLIDDAGDILGF